MKKKFTKMTDLPTLLVFTVFAVCVLMVLLYGARVYEHLAEQSEENFRLRTAAQYLRTRVWQAEVVCVTDFDGCEALTLKETIDGTAYLTRVYCHEGFLRELFGAESASLSPEDGEKIMPLESLQMEQNGSLLTLQADTVRLQLQLRGKEGVAP